MTTDEGQSFAHSASLLNFRAGDTTPIRVWSHAADDESSPRSTWTGLWEMEYPNDPTLSPFLRFGINNVDGEGFAVWRAAAFALCEGLERIVIPAYYRDEAAAQLGVKRESVELIRWEYEVDNDQPAIARADKGFVAARSCVPMRPAPDAFERSNAALAGAFRISTLEQFDAVDVAVSGDASSEVTILGLDGPDRVAEVLAGLRQRRRPKLHKLLEPGEVFVDVSIVRDRFLGQTSYLIVKAHDDRSEQIRSVAAYYNDAWNSYLQRVDDITTFEEFASAIEQLRAPPK